MKTKSSLINDYVMEEHIFNNIEELQSYIRENDSTPDYIAVDGLLYTMHEYDERGRELNYYNKRSDNMIVVITDNRYEYGFKDAEVELLENYGYYRNDIILAD